MERLHLSRDQFPREMGGRHPWRFGSVQRSPAPPMGLLRGSPRKGHGLVAEPEVQDHSALDFEMRHGGIGRRAS